MTPSSQATFDVSLVVNIHRGHAYLKKTMRSFDLALAFARQSGLRVEVLIVLDRSDSATIEWIERYVEQSFARLRVETVDYGSLGLSRDHGMRSALGNYVMFGDEDDLISANTIVESYRLAEEEGPSCIVVPEYMFGFGLKNFTARYFSSEYVSPHAFMSYHPFVSRIFVHRSIRDYMGFIDVPLSSGYAFEDWHFNATAFSLGYRYRPAPNTVLFYRHRAGLLDTMNTVTTRQIPPTRLFIPDIYPHVCENCEYMADRIFPQETQSNLIQRSFFDNPVLRKLVGEASLIEPEISLENLRHSPGISNTDGNLARGAGYLVACDLLNGKRFTDVLFWDSAVHEDGVLKLNCLVQALRHSEREVLVLNAGDAERSDLLNGAPEATMLNFDALPPALSDTDVDTIGMRLIESAAPNARLHLFSGDFSHRFLNNYGTLLKSHTMYLYYPEHHKPTMAFPAAFEAVSF